MSIRLSRATSVKTACQRVVLCVYKMGFLELSNEWSATKNGRGVCEKSIFKICYTFMGHPVEVRKIDFSNFCMKKSDIFWENPHILENIKAVELVLVSIDSSAHQLSNDTKTTTPALVVVMV